MIKFKKITYKNFLSVGNTPVAVDLENRGTSLITGINGSGKSTFADALTFSLFGKSYRKINKPKLVNSNNRKNCEVELQFSINSDQYVIKRGIDPNYFDITKNDKKIDQQSTLWDQQSWLEKNVLKMNYSTFSQVVILGAANYVPFMQLQTWQRREVVENLLDMLVFSKMNTILREKMNLWTVQRTELEGKLKVAQAKLESQVSFKAEIEKGHDAEIALAKKEISELKIKAMQLSNEKDTIQATIFKLYPVANTKEKLEKNYSDVCWALSQLETGIHSTQDSIEFFDINNDCLICKQTIDSGHKHAQLEVLHKELKEKVKANVEKTAEKGLVEEELKKAMKASSLLDTEKSKMGKLEVSLQHTADEGRKLVSKLNTLTASKRVEDVEAQIKDLQQQLADIEKERSSLTEFGEAYDISQKLLKDNGIKATIIKQYVPVINTIVNKYLSEFDFYVKFEFDENFEEKIKTRGREDFTYNSFSMGERTRIDLALMFAWREIARLRAQANTNLLILDEIADSSVDADGLDDLFTVFNTFPNASIFVISHREVNADKFNNQVKFEKVKGFTRMVSVG